MPELNREQIIAELQEIIDHFAGSLNRYWTLSNALTLIKQLTEENERLKADTVNRMVERLKERIHSKFSNSGWYVKDIIIKSVAEEIIKEVNCEKEEVQDNS